MQVMPLDCKFCGLILHHKSSLQFHMNTHTGERWFKCKICEKSFLSPSSRNCHEKKHFEDKLFKCHSCCKLFETFGNLKRHLEVHDVNRKKFNCKFCSKSLATEHSLNTHLMTHTGEKPHKCAKCHSEFSQAHHLRNHFRIHTGEKPYKCSHCNQAFAESSNLNKHQKRQNCSSGCQPKSSDGLLMAEMQQHDQTNTKPTKSHNFVNKLVDPKAEILQEKNYSEFYKIKYEDREESLPRGKNDSVGLAGTSCRRSSKSKLKSSKIQDRISSCKQCRWVCSTFEDLCRHNASLHNLPVVRLKRLVIVVA